MVIFFLFMLPSQQMPCLITFKCCVSGMKIEYWLFTLAFNSLRRIIGAQEKAERIFHFFYTKARLFKDHCKTKCLNTDHFNLLPILCSTWVKVSVFFYDSLKSPQLMEKFCVKILAGCQKLYKTLVNTLCLRISLTYDGAFQLDWPF